MHRAARCIPPQAVCAQSSTLHTATGRATTYGVLSALTYGWGGGGNKDIIAACLENLAGIAGGGGGGGGGGGRGGKGGGSNTLLRFTDFLIGCRQIY